MLISYASYEPLFKYWVKHYETVMCKIQNKLLSHDLYIAFTVNKWLKIRE